MRKREGVLASTKVLAFEQSVAAPLASRILAEYGADVIKIEPPGGDFSRHWDSKANGLSSYFVWLNRGKRSVAIDSRSVKGRELLRHLVSGVDVLLINSSPSSVVRLGLDYESARALNPTLVHCAISGYGSTGPYRDRKAYDLLVQGETGLISLTGSEDHAAKIGVSICDIGAGMLAAQAILAALLERDRTGQGSTIDVSMFDAMIEWMGGPITAVANGGSAPRREGMRHNMIVPYGPFTAADGKYVNLAVEQNREWLTFCRDVLDRPDLASNPEFATNELRLNNRRELEAIVETIIAGRDSEVWFRRLAAAGIPHGAVNGLKSVLDHPQLKARAAVKHARMGSRGANYIALDSQAAASDLPEVGEHTRQILGEFGLTMNEIRSLEDAGAIIATALG